MQKFKVVFKAESIDEILKIPHFKDILKLCQIWNTLISAQRFLLYSEKNQNQIISNRDIFYSLVTNTSYLFEGMKTTTTIFKRIAEIVPNDKQEGIAWIYSEIKKQNSFYNKVIAKIRNDIGFHFNYSITNLQIENVCKQFPLVFAESTSDKRIDLVYLMADHLLAEVSPFAIASDEDIRNIVRKLAKYTTKFCNYIEDIITVTIKEYLKFVK